MEEKKDQIVKLTPQKSILKEMYPAIKKALPPHKDPARFVSIILTVLNKEPKLMACTRGSLMGGIMLSSILGLEMGDHLGQCYLLPFNNTKTINGRKEKVLEAQFVIGYKGYPVLIKDGIVYAHCAYEGERFDPVYGLNKDLIHKPNAECIAKGKIIAAYAVIKLSNGFVDFLVMYKDELDKVRNVSKASDSPAWKNWPGEMHRKAPLMRLCKTAPLSAEDKKKVSQDQTTKYFKPDMSPDHILDLPDETNWMNGALVEPERERPPKIEKGKGKAEKKETGGKIDPSKDPSQSQEAETVTTDTEKKESKKADGQGDLFEGETGQKCR